jgi:hypothetical protein
VRDGLTGFDAWTNRTGNATIPPAELPEAARELMDHIPRRPLGLPHLWVMFIASVAALLVHVGSAHPCQSRVADVSDLQPVFSLPTGYYDRDVRLELWSARPDAEILFTLDGREPTELEGTVYRAPIDLAAEMPSVTVVRARLALPGVGLAPTATALYVVGLQPSLPILSLALNPDDLWHPTSGIYANPYEKGSDWERMVDATFLDPACHSGFQLSAGLRIHGGYTRSYEKKSFRLYFRQEYGAGRLEYPVFPGSDLGSFKRLVLHNSGQDSPQPADNWLLIRSPLISQLAREMGGYGTYSRPVILFLNGEPWGIYHLRERIDPWFLRDRFGIESADLLDTPQLAKHQVTVAGDREHWDHLLRFVEFHDLANPDFYAYAETQVDIANLIDYAILQIYSANIDWPHRNVNQFRARVQGGRWNWVFWDSDFSLGLEPLSRVDRNMMDQALLPDHPNTGGSDTLLLRRLLGNPAFLNRFLSRVADLLNGALAPQAVIARVDALAAQLENDIDYEAGRWFSASDWQANVQELREFAQNRPDYVRQHMVEAFELEGTAELTFSSLPDGAGRVSVNEARPVDLPWHGIFFSGTTIKVTAVPEPDYRFVGWEEPGLGPGPVATLTVQSTQTVTALFEPIGTDALRPGDVVLSNFSIEDGELELFVTRRGGIDLRRWRVTDNDTKVATDEGSLIFADCPAFTHVPQGTTIRIMLAAPAAGIDGSVHDDLDSRDRLMVLYVANGNLDAHTDPWFRLGPDDSLALLAPGPTDAFQDDQGIAFVFNSATVNPASFGVLADGVAADY